MKLLFGLWFLVLVDAQNITIPVRLVGSDGTRGDVYIFDKAYYQWRPMCDDGWNLRAATVVCRQLNLGPPVSIYSHSAGRNYGIESINCSGTESNIAECSYDTDHDCYNHETAGVICSPIQIRLVDGVHKSWKNTTRDGRVEVLSNGQWGTICDVGFDMQDADVICRQLGFPGAKRLGISREYGSGKTNTPIHLSNLQCTGNESEIYLCMGNENPTDCSHDNDVSVECLPPVKLTNGHATSDGLLEILYQGEWYTTCRPNQYSSRNNHGDVVCKELGFDGGFVFTDGRRKPISEHRYQLWHHNLYCEGTEDSIYDCASQRNALYFSHYRCSYLAEYSCQSLHLDNETNGTGLLEFYSTSEWIPVCSTEAFNDHAADVACQQLGYPFATNFSSVALPRDRPGIGITESVCEGVNTYSYRGYLFNCVNFTSMICQIQLHLICYNDGNTVRLIGSPVKHMGRVEVFDRALGQWGTICNDDVIYQSALAHITCRSLGYSNHRTYGRAGNSSNIALSSNGPILNGTFRCTHTYRASYAYHNLYQCSNFESRLGVAPSRCTFDQELIIACVRPAILVSIANVRLKGRISARYVEDYQGTVEVYNAKKNRFEYICDEGWDINDAHVVCHMLGFPGALDATLRSEYGEPAPAYASLSAVQCNGTEDLIYDCPHESISYCSKSQSAGVQCLATRLVDGPNQYSGRVEVYNINYFHAYESYSYTYSVYNHGTYQIFHHRSYRSDRIFPQQWGTICDDQWTVRDAAVVCRSLGYHFDKADFKLNESYSSGNGPIWTNYVSCLGSENYIWDCSHNLRGNWYRNYRPKPCNHSMDIGITCSAPLPVRLQGSPYASAGRLEVWRNNMWGSVCNEHFTIEAANVVCRQLGFDQALDYTPGGYFGQSTGPIHMSNVMCSGNEAAITDCTFSTTHSCDHSQDVGIYCQDIRLSRGINAAEGIIEINEDHRWRTVCNKTFNDFAAALVCRQLRFGLPVQYHGNSLVVHSEVFFITYYSSSTFCRESSQRFSNCLYYYRSTRNCHDTFLKCSSLRLEDSEAKFSGRVEILYNGEWGTVCSDEFDENDAAVVCHQAGYGPPLRYWIDPSHRRHGRIWLDDLQCEGTEDTLFECQSNTWGDTNCDHTQDVFVQCVGFCEQSINSTDYIVTYDKTPSYTQSTATLKCIKGYASIEPGSAICGDDGEWIISYPECEALVRLVDESGNTCAVFNGGIDEVSRGRVELLINGEWNTICSRGFGLKEANIICNQLGLNGARRVRTGYYGAGSGGIVALKNRGCDGGESDILNCDLQSASASNLNCSHDQDVGIECLDVRLVSTDSRTHAGRIEVFFNNEWGQICYQGNSTVLSVVCAQLGYGSVGAVPFSISISRNAPIWLDNDVECVGDEDTIFDCPSLEFTDIGKVVGGYCSGSAAGVICPVAACRPFPPPKNGYYVHDVQQVYYHHTNTLQVACKDGYDLISLGSDTLFDIAECQDGIWNDTFFCEKQIKLTYGFKHSAGHVEIFDKYHNDYKPVCDRNWDLNDANVICHQLGYPGAVRATTRSYFTYKTSSSPSQHIRAVFNNVDCTGLEESIFDCLDIFGMPLDISTLDSCPSLRTAGVICNENIRLTGGSTIYEGRVEAFMNGQWGSVCSDGISENEAETLCQSLGFGPFHSIINDTMIGDRKNIPALIGDLVCSEYHDHFMKCTFNQSSSMCSSVNHLALKCYPGVRFVEDGVRSPWEGEIEVYYGGQWDRVCNIDWDINDADVVCRELGFSGATSAEYSRATNEVHAAAILDGALCTGEELHLLDCPLFVPLSDVTNNCLGNYAGVTCMTDCPLLSSPEHGHIINATGNTINDTIIIGCFENFTLVGSAIRRCQPNGQWSGTVTKCVATCKIEDATRNEKVKVEPVKSQYIEDDQVIIVCDSGYQMTNTSDPIIVRICMSDRTWSGINPHCEKIPGLATSSNQRQAKNRSGSDSSVAVTVLAVVLVLTVLTVIIGIVMVYLKNRSIGVKCGGGNASTKDDDKQLVINPVYADETNESN